MVVFVLGFIIVGVLIASSTSAIPGIGGRNFLSRILSLFCFAPIRLRFLPRPPDTGEGDTLFENRCRPLKPGPPPAC